LLLSDKDTKWELFDRKSGKIVDGEPAPEHLLLVADSVEEAIVTASKLCMRPNDTARGRQIKLLHYIDLHKKYLGKEPEDIEKFIRSKQDIPAEYVDKIKAGYREAIDPSLL
jgi:acetyl-CoA decarbonylase/synthase complex subunit alpha